MNFHSSILYVGNRPLPKIDLDYDFATDTDSIFPLPKSQHSVFIVDIPSDTKKQNKILSLTERMIKDNNEAQLIFIAESVPVNLLLKLKNVYGGDKILMSLNGPELQSSILGCIENFHLEKQNRDLIELYEEQNNKLQKLTSQLENKVGQRQSYLEETKQRSIDMSRRLKIILDSAVAAQESESFEEIESKVLDVICEPLDTSRISILVEAVKGASSSKKKEAGFSVAFQLQSGEEGSISFTKKKKQKFDANEKRLLRQITDTISISIERVIRLKQTQQLTDLWKSTFNSILDPVVIIDSDYDIVQGNAIISNQLEESGKRKCFEVMFDRESPCENCQIGNNFRISQKERHIEVSSQKLTDAPSSFVNVYKDITDEIKLQKQVLEKAKIAELGTIGGSIAHELNNPLAGIITLIQLIKEDFQDNKEHSEDVLEMERAAFKCKEIIEKLLNFTRVPTEEEFQDLDLIKIIQESASIVEIKSKSRGIHISVTSKEDECPVRLQREYLNQLLLLLLNEIVEVNANKLDASHTDQTELFIQVIRKRKEYLVEIKQLIHSPTSEIKNLSDSLGELITKKASSLASVLEGEVKALVECKPGKPKNSLEILWARISLPLGNN